MDETTTSFGYWVRRQRRALDLTQRTLADCVGCSTATIKKIEADERRPSRQIAGRLAACLHVTDDQRDHFLAVAQREHAVDTLLLATAAAPASAALSIIPHSVVAARFVGRQVELHAIEARLLHEGCRLLSVVGLGGVGKTRLVMEAAATLTPFYADGVCFVPLSDIENAPDVAKAILRRLGLPVEDGTDPVIQLVTALRHRRLLLVLDNMEQLLHEPATCDLLVELLAAAPRVALLVTSRERLNLQAEWVLPLQGLPLDDPAIALFADRARQAGYAGVLSTPAVATICQIVEGLPLAVELAAGWTQFMTPEQIAEQLHSGLPVLNTRLRDVPERHRSLQALFDQSWVLLTEVEQAIFMRLAVFRGGFESEAAAVVAGADLPALLRLVDKSLVHPDGRGRYELHALARHYALGQLTTANAVEEMGRRHADYFFDLVRRIADQRYDPAPDHWQDRVQAEYINIQAAWQWALNARQWAAQAPPDNASKYALALLALATRLFRTGHVAESLPYANEGYRWALMTEEPNTVAMAEMHRGLMAADVAARESHFQAALAACRQSNNRSLLANALMLHGDFLREQGALEAAHVQYTESLTHARALEDEKLVIYPMGNLGRLALLDGAIEHAYMRFVECIAMARAQGNAVALADWLLRLGIVQVYQHESTAAHATLTECVKLAENLNHQHCLMNARLWLAAITLEQGNGPAAQKVLQLSLVAYQRRLEGPGSAHPSTGELIEALVVAAFGYANQIYGEEAAEALGCAEALATQPHAQLDPFLAAIADRARTQLAEMVDQATLEAALARGRATSALACFTTLIG